jgi:hypothetical protein
MNARRQQALRRYGWAWAMLVATSWLVGCGEPIGGYIPAQSIAENGFISDRQSLSNVRGWEVKLWGFVDRGNL